MLLSSRTTLSSARLLEGIIFARFNDFSLTRNKPDERHVVGDALQQPHQLRSVKQEHVVLKTRDLPKHLVSFVSLRQKADKFARTRDEADRSSYQQSRVGMITVHLDRGHISTLQFIRSEQPAVAWIRHTLHSCRLQVLNAAPAQRGHRPDRYPAQNVRPRVGHGFLVLTWCRRRRMGSASGRAACAPCAASSPCAPPRSAAAAPPSSAN